MKENVKTDKHNINNEKWQIRYEKVKKNICNLGVKMGFVASLVHHVYLISVLITCSRERIHPPQPKRLP